MSGIMQMMLGAPFASAAFLATISSNQTDLNLRTWALANGWNGTAQATITVGSGVIISGSVQGNSTAALTIDGSWPGGITLINSGVIAGRGGTGGAGGSASSTNGVNGNIGGTALTVSVSASVNNAGTIAGGGGGGGGGGLSLGGAPGGDDSVISYYGGCGGGGGASSNTTAAGGAAGSNGGLPGASGNAGGSGTYNSAGLGGTKTLHASGGNGGSWGATGSNGGAGSYTAGLGGAGGRAVNGNASITWIATGTRLGSIV